MPGKGKDRRRGGNPGKDHVVDEDGNAASRAERTAVFGKTKLCKFFILGCCTKGKDCAFAHDQSEMNPTPDLSRTKICKTLINTGVCNKPDCTYAHNKEELREMPGSSVEMVRSQADEKTKGYSNQQKVSPTSSMGKQVPRAQSDQAAAQAQSMMNLQMMQHIMMSQMLAQQPEMDKAKAKAAQFQMPGMVGNQPLSLHSSLFQESVLSSKTPDIEKDVTEEGTKPSGEISPLKKDARCVSVRCSCGNFFKPNARFCPACGAATENNKYNVKNTFVDVEHPSLSAIKTSALRPWQSDIALNTLWDSDSPVCSSPQENMSALTSEDGLLKSPQHGLEGFVPTFNPRIPRVNTWASDLEKVAEEESPREDLDVSPECASEDNAPSEKRLQDTPLSDTLIQEFKPRGIDQQMATEALPMEMRVKNTFIEFKTDPHQPRMRMVQTAAGRLDLLGGD